MHIYSNFVLIQFLLLYHTRYQRMGYNGTKETHQGQLYRIGYQL